MGYHETACEAFWLLAGLAEMMAAQLPDQFQRERSQRRINELMARVTAAMPKPVLIEVDVESLNEQSRR